jgi:hypothetical protein
MSFSSAHPPSRSPPMVFVLKTSLTAPPPLTLPIARSLPTAKEAAPPPYLAFSSKSPATNPSPQTLNPNATLGATATVNANSLLHTPGTTLLRYHLSPSSPLSLFPHHTSNLKSDSGQSLLANGMKEKDITV